ncbi:MAG: hypothetical protein LQ339_000365 [Xanthoria mediterranea]|nr:MAG: hypothetical protein LQ339_000365 [Xanthoria mediterranea]
MRFLNPGGHDFIGANLDGWGVIQLLFAILYTLVLLVLCGILWKQRDHPIIRMRKIPMAIAAVLVLHVYLVIVLIVYTLNGYFPCNAEFWIMSIYLPIGIGLFQAQNQQLLLISRGQQVLLTQHAIKPLPAGKTRWQYYRNKFVLWCKSSKEQDAFEGFIAAGMLVQFLGSLLIYVISRKFNSYGVVSQPTTQTLCRRGWEWAPSIIWQASWNFIAGPYLLWKIRMIRDIYNWRLQTTIAIVAGLPGTPLWLAAVYSDLLNGVSKYWTPAMWFVPGLITMQMITILSALFQVWRSKKQAKEVDGALNAFDVKKQIGTVGPNASIVTTSTKTKGSGSSRVPMKTMEDCLTSNGLEYNAFYHFCTTKTFNGENLVFLDKTIKFKLEWRRIFNLLHVSPNAARLRMYRDAVDIYLTLIWDKTAKYPINIPSTISRDLNTLFQSAAAIVAANQPSTGRSSSNVTPWDEPSDPFASVGDHPLRPMLRHSLDKGSATKLITELEHCSPSENDHNNDISLEPSDPLHDVHVPADFNESCFDAAFASIKHMMWEQPYQDFMKSKRNSASSA